MTLTSGTQTVKLTGNSQDKTFRSPTNMVVISYVEVEDMEAIQFIIAYKTGRLKITDENYFTAYTKVLFQSVIYQFDNNMYIMKCETSRRV